MSFPARPRVHSPISRAFKDPQGAWVAVGAIAFSFVYGPSAVGSAAPRTPLDLVDPRWKGNIVVPAR